MTSRRIRLPLKSGFEKKIARLLIETGVDFKYEDTEIPYVLESIYTPDFSLGDGVFIETKGNFDVESRRKHLAVKKQNPDVTILFIFQRDNKIHPKSKTRYSDWCKKHGFEYYVGEGLPVEWIKKYGTKKPPRSTKRKSRNKKL